MTSLADHVLDPFCLRGKGEGWTAPLGLHWFLPQPRLPGMQETPQDFSLATGPVSRSRFCRRMWLQHPVSKPAPCSRMSAQFGSLWTTCRDGIMLITPYEKIVSHQTAVRGCVYLSTVESKALELCCLTLPSLWVERPWALEAPGRPVFMFLVWWFFLP